MYYNEQANSFVFIHVLTSDISLLLSNRDAQILFHNSQLSKLLKQAIERTVGY